MAFAEDDRVVLFEFLRVCWGAVSRQITWCGAERHAIGAERARDNAAVGDVANAEGDVDALVDQVDIAVGEGDVEDDVRCAGLKAGEGRGKHVSAEGDGRGDAQTSARFTVQGLRVFLGAGDTLQDVVAMLEVGGAEFGEALAAGGAVEQAGAEAVF